MTPTTKRTAPPTDPSQYWFDQAIKAATKALTRGLPLEATLCLPGALRHLQNTSTDPNVLALVLLLDRIVLRVGSGTKGRHGHEAVTRT